MHPILEWSPPTTSSSSSIVIFSSLSIWRICSVSSSPWSTYKYGLMFITLVLMFILYLFMILIFLSSSFFSSFSFSFLRSSSSLTFCKFLFFCKSLSFGLCLSLCLFAFGLWSFVRLSDSCQSRGWYHSVSFHLLPTIPCVNDVLLHLVHHISPWSSLVWRVVLVIVSAAAVVVVVAVAASEHTVSDIAYRSCIHVPFGWLFLLCHFG